MVFVIHWHESAMDLHVFPIPIPLLCFIKICHIVLRADWHGKGDRHLSVFRGVSICLYLFWASPLVPRQHPGNIMNHTHFVYETACTLILIEAGVRQHHAGLPWGPSSKLRVHCFCLRSLCTSWSLWKLCFLPSLNILMTKQRSACVGKLVFGLWHHQKIGFQDSANEWMNSALRRKHFLLH